MVKDNKIEKRFNKVLIGAVLGTTLIGLAGASMTPKGRSAIGKLKDFLAKGVKELSKSAKTQMGKGKDIVEDELAEVEKQLREKKAELEKIKKQLKEKGIDQE